MNQKYRVWMYDEFGYRFAFLMEGDYNIVNVMGSRLATMLGCTLDWVETYLQEEL